MVLDGEESEIEDIREKLNMKYDTKKINTKVYFREVKRILLNDMDTIGPVGKVHVFSFYNKFDRVKGNSYKLWDPSFDAWMCLRGDERECFDTKAFIKMYPSVKGKIKDLRERLHMSLIWTPYKHGGRYILNILCISLD